MLQQTTITVHTLRYIFPVFITHLLVMTDRPMGEYFSTLTELYKAAS